MNMKSKRIVVIFPGGNYSADCPLLYYAGFKYETRDYEKVTINFQESTNKNNSFDENVDSCKSMALNQLKSIDFFDFEDVVFVSKSIGTVIAGWMEEKLAVKVRHIFLTPIQETLPYIKKDKNIIAVISGTKDKYLDSEFLKNHCKENDIFLKQIEGAGHRLEIWGDMDRNIDILREIVELY